jgi:hypothetical protein
VGPELSRRATELVFGSSAGVVVLAIVDRPRPCQARRRLNRPKPDGASSSPSSSSRPHQPGEPPLRDGCAGGEQAPTTPPRGRWRAPARAWRRSRTVDRLHLEPFSLVQKPRARVCACSSRRGLLCCWLALACQPGLAWALQPKAPRDGPARCSRQAGRAPLVASLGLSR